MGCLNILSGEGWGRKFLRFSSRSRRGRMGWWGRWWCGGFTGCKTRRDKINTLISTWFFKSLGILQLAVSLCIATTITLGSKAKTWKRPKTGLSLKLVSDVTVAIFIFYIQSIVKVDPLFFNLFLIITYISLLSFFIFLSLFYFIKFRQQTSGFKSGKLCLHSILSSTNEKPIAVY